MRFASCLLLVAQGCGGGGGTGDLAVPADLASTAPTAAIAATPDLVGFDTALDGSGSSDPLGRTLTFAWHVVSAPPGSAVVDATLSSTSGAKVSFAPDLGGDYLVQLTVSTSDGASAMTQATATVPTLPIFYHQGVFQSGSSTMAVGVMRSDGSGKHLVSCPDSADGGVSGVFGWAITSMFSVSTWEPPASSLALAQFAFPEVVVSSGVVDNRLLIANEESDCASHAPPRVDPSSDAFYSAHAHRWPRFSPDGTRLLYVDNPSAPAGTSRLVSVGIDGSNLRVIRTMGDLSSAPPVWVDATHVAWVEETGTMMAPKPIIYQASDASFAGDSATAPGDRSALIDCTGVLTVINQFAVVTTNATTALLVAGGAMSKAAGGEIDLYRITGGLCSLATPLLSEPAGGDAGDFAVSPDGTTLITSTTHGQGIPDGGPTPQHDLFILPADGSSAPKFFAGDPAVDDLGPHWLAGGRQIWWTQGGTVDGGVRGAGILIANADGTHQRSLYAESTVAGVDTVVLGGSNSGISCAFGDGRDLATGSAGLLLVVALFGFWYARRAKGE